MLSFGWCGRVCHPPFSCGGATRHEAAALDSCILPASGLERLMQSSSTAEARGSYRRRGRVVEFGHAWIKSKLGLRQFHVRGLVKVQMETLWACLTYNLQQWIRLRKPLPTPATG
jgi:hypothetical protein